MKKTGSLILCAALLLLSLAGCKGAPEPTPAPSQDTTQVPDDIIETPSPEVSGTPDPEESVSPSPEVTPVPELETPCAAYEADSAAYAALSCGRPVALSALTRLSFGAEPRPDSPVVIKSNKIFSICRAAKKGGTLELSPDVNIILSGGLE